MQAIARWYGTPAPDVLPDAGRGRANVLGVRDLVIVATKDAVLVIPKERAQDVRRVVEAAKQSGRDDLL